MKSIWLKLLTWCLLFLPSLAWANEGLDIPEELKNKVSLDGLSGISLFFARTYNENLWLYAISCTVLMGVVGVAIAFVADLVLSAMGMDVHKIEHKE